MRITPFAALAAPTRFAAANAAQSPVIAIANPQQRRVLEGYQDPLAAHRALVALGSRAGILSLVARNLGDYDLRKPAPVVARSGAEILPFPTDRQATPTDKVDAVKGIKAIKLGMSEFTDPPVKERLIPAMVQRRFGHHFVGHEVDGIFGDMDRGLVVRGAELGVLLAVPSRHHLALGKPQIDDEGHFRTQGFTYGRRQGSREIFASMLRHNKPEIAEELRMAEERLMDASGTLAELYCDPTFLKILQHGSEREFFIVDSTTGELWRIFDEELIAGQGEVRDGVDDVGIYIDPMAAARGMAAVRAKLEALYPDALILDIGAPPSGTPQNTRINTKVINHKGEENGIAIYIAAQASRHSKQYWPRTDASRRFRLTQAAQAGFVSGRSRKSQDQALRLFFDSLGDNRLWTVSAAHQSEDAGNVLDADSGRYEADIMHMVNLADVKASLNVFARLVTATGPYNQGLLVTDADGRPMYNARDALRKDLGSAERQTHPIRTPERLIDIITQNMTNGEHGSNVLGRAGSAVTVQMPDGTLRVTKAIAHGDIRLRIENIVDKSTPKGANQITYNMPSARLEYTGATASSTLMRARQMAVSQMLGFLALQATNRGMHVFDYISSVLNDGTTADDLWLNTDDIVDDFQVHGPASTQAARLVDLLRRVIVKVNAPKLVQIKQQALWALDNLLILNTTFADLAQGRGTLGAAMVDLANRGIDGLTAAKIVHAFESAEAEFLREASDKEVMDYFAGQGGFEFNYTEYLNAA